MYFPNQIEIMIVEYKNRLFVKVPEDVYNFKIAEWWLMFRWPRFSKASTRPIPPGPLQIIGKADQLADADWEEIVEKDGNFFRLYNFKYWSDGSTSSPTLSGHTLIKSLGFDSTEECLILKKV